MKLHKIAATLFIAAALSTAVPASLQTPYTVTAEAHHHGRSYGYDGYGGHCDYDYSCGFGSYHYHHGYGAHMHPDGICPYQSTVPTSQTNTAALLAQQQAALLAQQQQAALLAQQQQAALLAQQQQLMSIVMQTQAALQQFGFYNGEINGIWDLPTQQALVLFQTAYGLTADGSINDQIITLFNIH